MTLNKKAVLFDLDDTLVVDEAVSQESLGLTAEYAREHHGAEPDRFRREAVRQAVSLWKSGPSYAYCRAIGISAFECLWGDFLGENPDLRVLREWSLEYRSRVFDGALREQKIESATAGQGLAETFSSARRRLQRLMPDAKETLTRLSGDYQLGLLTNGAPSLQREKIFASGLGDFFQAAVISGEFGMGKPQAEIFRHLLAELGLEPKEAIMVGNSLERDIAGARNAGITSVWIKVPGSEEPAAVEPDFTILGLSEIPRILSEGAGDPESKENAT